MTKKTYKLLFSPLIKGEKGTEAPPKFYNTFKEVYRDYTIYKAFFTLTLLKWRKGRGKHGTYGAKWYMVGIAAEQWRRDWLEASTTYINTEREQSNILLNGITTKYNITRKIANIFREY